MNYKKPVIIAEIGCNHKGDFEIAKQLLDVAKKFCEVDAAKFQKRNSRELLSPEEYDAPHPNPDQSYGKTYGEHREFLEFNKQQHEELKKTCDTIGVVYSTSVWDLTSAKEIVALQPAFIKIPSASNLKFDILEYLCDNFGGEIHISLGMTTREEEKKIIDFLVSKNRAKDVILYHCTSGYPVPFDQLYLLEIKRLKETYGDIVKDIGFSGHHLGISADIAAYTLGANYFERHFTIDRTWKGTDHSASLEPDGMRRLVRDLNTAYKALTYKQKDIADIEEQQRKKLKRF